MTTPESFTVTPVKQGAKGVKRLVPVPIRGDSPSVKVSPAWSGRKRRSSRKPSKKRASRKTKKSHKKRRGRKPKVSTGFVALRLGKKGSRKKTRHRTKHRK